MTKKALLYCRTSTDDIERDSMSAQERVCQEWANNNGYEVVEVIREDVRGISGASYNVDGLKRAKELARRRAYDTLVIRDVGRFARDQDKFFMFSIELKRYAVKTVFVWQDFDDSPMGKAYKMLAIMFAEVERGEITRRTNFNKRDKIQNRQSMIANGMTPLGFDVKKINGRWTPLPVEKELFIVRKVFDFYVTQDLSLKQTKLKLEAEKVPTWTDLRGGDRLAKKKRGEFVWSETSIKRILRNRLYIGEWYYGKYGEATDIEYLEDGDVRERRKFVKNDESSWILVRVEPTIPLEIFEAAQRKLGRNKPNGRHPGYEYLLSRRIRCECGSTLLCHHGTNYFYYICAARDGKIANRACDMAYVRANELDNLVWNWLKSLLTDRGEFRKRITDYYAELKAALQPVVEERSIVESDYEQKQAEYQKLIKLMLKTDEIGEEAMTPMKLQLERELKALGNKIDELARLENAIQGDMQLGPGELQDWLDWQDIEAQTLEHEAETSFEKRLEYIKKYDVQVVVKRKEGKMLAAHVSCKIGTEVMDFLSHSRWAMARKPPKHFTMSFSDILTWELPRKQPAYA